MKIALLSPIAWQTPPLHYGPWENMVSLLAEGLQQEGIKVSVFATGDSASANLEWVCPHAYEEDRSLDPKVWECLHIAHLFEQADRFDLIHNHYDFLPLTYSRLISTPVLTTIHGFSSPQILPVYKKYNTSADYVSISYADRHPDLHYTANIYHGLDLEQFRFEKQSGEYLLYFGRIHPDKGTAEAIDIARKSRLPLILAGIIQDQKYFLTQVAPALDEANIRYVGPVGPKYRNELLGGALALLHPIHFAEPFGLSVIEAQACGTPIIAFNKGSMPEVIVDGVTGYLVNDTASAVIKIKEISNLNRLDCRLWVEERFSRQRMVADYLDVYEQILNAAAPSLLS
ncbi:MAG TPA: glycosyltransferase family 4 protein [Syntrophomonas sp.]|nr:glycosyltransferase family 4 protein [Syntrophomonas sp.]HRW12725.1 glycosyltransferase family 4 protein [Syntrophomonas sp.]